MLLDELVFKNRNKDYGAYDLKKRYYKYVIISLFISTCIFLFIFVLPLIVHINKQLTIEKFSKTTSIMAMEMMKVDLEMLEKEKNNLPKLTSEKPIPEELPESSEPDLTLATDSINESSDKESKADSLQLQEEKQDPRLDSPGIFECGSNLLNFRMWFMENFKCPVDERIKKSEGRIMVVFTVNEEGLIDSVAIISGIDPIIDNEAKRVLMSAPRWKPCFINGRKVKQLYHFPIYLVRKIK